MSPFSAMDRAILNEIRRYPEPQQAFVQCYSTQHIPLLQLDIKY